MFYKFLRKEVSWCHDMVCYLSLLSLAMSDELDCLAVWGVYPTWYRLLCTLGPRILGYGGKGEQGCPGSGQMAPLTKETV